MTPRQVHTTRFVRVVLLIALVSAVGLSSTACFGPLAARTSTKGAVEATGTVQSEGFSGKSDLTAAEGGPWPSKVSQFAQKAGGIAWYPAYLPSGFKIQSVDVVEMEPGAGLVCDLLFISGDKVINFTQGSPKARDYEIVSTGTTPWGPDTADLVVEDPEDPSKTTLIVISKDGNFAELRGDVAPAELRKIAASMKVVK